MLSILNLLREKKQQLGEYLIITCVFLLVSLQVYTLYEICSNTYKESKELLYNTLLAKTTQLNTTKSPSASLAVFSYGHDKNSVRIRKGQRIDTTIYLDEKIDIDLLICKGTYDARDVSLWSLDTLGGLLKATFKYQAFTPPFSLHLTNKDGKTLETYNHDMSSLPAWTYRFDIPLGFLDHHQLSAKLIYPMSYLWSEIWERAITTLSLTILLILSIWYIAVQWQKEKRASEFAKDTANRIVHDLRSPLLHLKHLLPTVIGLDPKEQLLVIDKCEKKISKMLDHTSFLLSAAMSAYKIEVYKEILDLNKIINTVVEEHQNSCSDKHIIITVENQLTGDVDIDEDQIQGALGNIVENAVKYSGPVPRIDIRCWIENKRLMISVKDNGLGIPKSEQKNIFKKGYRVLYKANIIQPEGNGVGLHYVKDVLRAHKGDITVYSDGKNGSTFTLEFPQKKKKS